MNLYWWDQTAALLRRRDTHPPGVLPHLTLLASDRVPPNTFSLNSVRWSEVSL